MPRNFVSRIDKVEVDPVFCFLGVNKFVFDKINKANYTKKKERMEIAQQTIRPPKVLLFLIILCLPFLFTHDSFCDTFDLTYSLTEGGYRLELNQANPYKGVRLEVISDVATRYEIRQRIIMPLESRDKPGEVIRDAFVFRGLSGSNRYGDFRLPSNDISVRQDDIIYVSDVAGDPDSFTLVFGVNRMEDLEPGNYFGRIGFILSPIGSTRSQVTKIVDVYVNISYASEAAPRIEISTAQGSKNLSINSKQEDKQTADVLIKINGKFKEAFSIMQFLAEPFESEDGNRLDNENLNFVVQEAKKGVAVNRITPLSSGLQTIYSSMPSGEADDYFIVNYIVKDLENQKAGRYKSRIQYLLETKGQQSKLETLQFEIVNERIFDLIVTPDDQRYTIEFSNVKPTEPPRITEVLVEVVSNTGKRYQVSQDVYSELTNKEGVKIPKQYFTMRTQSMDSKGALKFSTKQEVEKGNGVLYISDNHGSADKFKVVYELECPKDINAGDYSTRIAYTLSEI